MCSWLKPLGEEWVDKHEAARLLGCDERTVDRMRERGQLHTYKVRGWYVRFKREEVQQFCHPQPQGPVEQQSS